MLAAGAERDGSHGRGGRVAFLCQPGGGVHLSFSRPCLERSRGSIANARRPVVPFGCSHVDLRFDCVPLDGRSGDGP